jgi:hypothetical protein
MGLFALPLSFFNQAKQILRMPQRASIKKGKARRTVVHRALQTWEFRLDSRFRQASARATTLPCFGHT